MNFRSYNILLLGDASNYHRTLADGLRDLGHSVTVASNGNRWMQTERDIDLSRPYDNKFGGAILWLKANKLARNELSGFDIVSVIGESFIALRPDRKSRLLDIIRRNNKHLFFTYLGTDTNYVEMCIDADSPLRYNEWRVDGESTPYARQAQATLDGWRQSDLRALNRRFYDDTEGVVTALYEYDMAARRVLPPEKIAYGGIPVNVSAIEPIGVSESGKIRFMLGMHRERAVEKGAERLLAAAQKLVERYPDRCELDVVENLPITEFYERMGCADVVLDQLYSYTPATTALNAMAMGKVVVSGGEPEYYDFIGEKTLRPIINALPDDEALFASLESLVNQERGMLRVRGLSGRDFVAKHNDLSLVARRFVDFWNTHVQS